MPAQTGYWQEGRPS